jgi:hypothetical protein
VGIKYLDGQFIELFSLRPHKNAYFLWTPGSEKHITTINEKDAVSSHVTLQKEDVREPLGRLDKNVELDEDEMMTDLLKPRKMDKEEYDKPVFYVNKNYQTMVEDNQMDMETEETEKEILMYIDLSELFENAQRIVEAIIETNQLPFGVCPARELLFMENVEVGVNEEQFAVMVLDGELWEIETKNLYQFGREEHPWNEYLKPLGVFELLKDVDFRFDADESESIE